MSTIRDVTDLWKAELQKEAMANDLVKRNNELEQFTYIVSHNLRSPVASLIGLTEVLSEFELREDEKKEIIAGISQSANRLDEVIRDLNDILHLKNNQEDKKEKVVFSTLVSEIERGIQQDFNARKYVIETDFSSVNEHYTVKNYMVSIFSNLISNSIKYRRQEEVPVIKIKSEVDGPPHGAYV
jgi:signal transduction histidine kinase